MAALLIAQSTTSLRGIVSDAKGPVVPGASVNISDPRTGFARAVTTGDDGVYQFLQVPPATYIVTVTRADFL